VPNTKVRRDRLLQARHVLAQLQVQLVHDT